MYSIRRLNCILGVFIISFIFTGFQQKQAENNINEFWAKITWELELYSSISDNYPSGRLLKRMKVNDKVKVLQIFQNDSESKFAIKVRTEDGIMGYLKGRWIQLLEPLNDKGTILAAHLSMQYEYEGNIELVDDDIKKYKDFLDKYPNSIYAPEAILTIAWLNLYSLQCWQSEEQKLKRIEYIKNCYIEVIKRLDISSENFYSFWKFGDNFKKFIPSSFEPKN